MAKVDINKITLEIEKKLIDRTSKLEELVGMYEELQKHSTVIGLEHLIYGKKIKQLRKQISELTKELGLT